LLVTSSVGVLDGALPLDTPMLVADVMMPDNRLPDGTPCTMFRRPSAGQGHLVLDEGLCSEALGSQIEQFAVERGQKRLERVVFAYAMGPRTKTAAENALLRSTGAQVNSMTLAPEVILANELEISVAALVVGHKYSVPGVHDRLDREGTAQSLATSAEVLTPLVRDYLDRAEPVSFSNSIYRY
jgi:purine nucleoside phosphorylase